MVDAAVRAGIDLCESTLRYAEVEQYGSRYRLLRLGSCSFDFNVTHELLRTRESEHLQTVSEALGDIFSGSVASRLHIAVHPPDCYSFFVPLPVYLPRRERAQRLKQEADLLIEAPLEAPLRLHEESLFTENAAEEHVEWFHVLGLADQAGRHLDRVLEQAPQHAYRPRLSMQGAATAALHDVARTTDGGDDAATLVFGIYPTHTELTVCEGARWRFSRSVPAGPPADVAYFGYALMQHLGLDPSAVGRVYLYGADPVDADEYSVLEEVFGVAPQALDALRALDIDRASLSAQFDAAAYVPCVGAAL